MNRKEPSRMLELANIDLQSDPESARFIKEETVRVSFAKVDGELMSRVGPNRYKTGDALISGSDGDYWCVSRDRFDVKYEPVPPVKSGHDGAYINKPRPVLARQMKEAFSIARCAGGDVLKGGIDDWLVQYAAGDFGIVDNARFKKVYHRI